MLLFQILVAITPAILVECQRTTTIFKAFPQPLPTLGPAKPLAGVRGAGPYIAETADALRPLDAHMTQNNPMSIVYAAFLYAPNGFSGRVTAQGGPGGTGVRYRIDAYGLYGYGPFAYHVHEQRVPANGDCYSIGERLDPFSQVPRGPCKFSNPKTCEIGDLSGKYGKLDAQANTSKQFVDWFSSLRPNEPGYIGNRSIAIVDNTGYRLACANFAIAEDIEYEEFVDQINKLK